MIQINSKMGYNIPQFNPAFYKSAYQQYEKGVFRDLIAMMNRAEIDSHINGCLIGRRAGFQKEFHLYPFSDSDADIERAEWIESIINQLDARNFFKGIHEAILKKYVVIDFDWQVVDGKQIPVKHRKLDQKYFRYKDGILMVDWGNRAEPIPDEAIVAESSEIPVLLPVLRDFILKEFGLESWASFIETFGEGFIIGKYPPGSDSAFKMALEDGINALARSSRGIMPDGSTIDIIEAKRSTGDHDKFEDRCNKGIAISILGHANAVEESQGMKIGENLSQYKVKREIAVDDMYFLDNQARKLVKMLIDRNFGDSRYPIFEFDKSEPVNTKEWLEVLDTAYNHGLKIHPDEYRKIGLYVFEDQEPLQKPPSPF